VASLPQGGALGLPDLSRARRALGVRLSGPDWTLPLAAVALAASASVVTWSEGLAWTPDRMLLVFLAPALVLRRAVRYLRDFVPFALLIFAYAECRGLAHLISPHPFYRPQLWLERSLFGAVPAQWLQAHFWRGTVHWYDPVAKQLLQLHFVVPPLLAFGLWVKRRTLFFRFATSMVVLSFAAAVVFAAFPAAPPWAAARAGYLPPVVKLPQASAPDVSSAGLSPHTFSVSSVIPGNPYAAVPSLHAGYAFLVFLTIASLLLRRRGRFRWPLVGLFSIYPLLQALAVVYTGNHYVIDIVIGFGFAFAAFAATNRLWARLGLPS
jgi:membrane-associated phospholipid phosphatase